MMTIPSSFPIICNIFLSLFLSLACIMALHLMYLFILFIVCLTLVTYVLYEHNYVYPVLCHLAYHFKCLKYTCGWILTILRSSGCITILNIFLKCITLSSSIWWHSCYLKNTLKSVALIRLWLKTGSLKTEGKTQRDEISDQNGSNPAAVCWWRAFRSSTCVHISEWRIPTMWQDNAKCMYYSTWHARSCSECFAMRYQSIVTSVWWEAPEWDLNKHENVTCPRLHSHMLQWETEFSQFAL